MLKDATNAMGRLAIVLADSINQQHQLGMDLEGHLGSNFFVDVNNDLSAASRFIGNDDNALPLDRVGRVDIVDTSELTTDDYRLELKGPTDLDYVLSRVSNGESVRSGTLPGYYPAEIEVKGFKITLQSGSFSGGDEYLIQPTRHGAWDFGLLCGSSGRDCFGCADTNRGQFGQHW